jgi:hypothetical protein
MSMFAHFMSLPAVERVRFFAFIALIVSTV